MSYYVYILYSASLEKYYTGSCEDLSIRLNNQHNRGRVISTKAGIPWILKYTEAFETRSEAVKRENQIKKKKSRTYIELLISSSG
jgi:putative endonuclease